MPDTVSAPCRRLDMRTRYAGQDVPQAGTVSDRAVTDLREGAPSPVMTDRRLFPVSLGRLGCGDNID